MKYGRGYYKKSSPRGTKERIAILLGYQLDFDGRIVDKDFNPVKINFSNCGYATFSCGGYNVMAHRFVFHFTHGDIDPKKVIDHIDGNRTNYKIENLRRVTISGNNRNRLKGKTWMDVL